VIIHRAILGSVERMMAVLVEHTAGKWCVGPPLCLCGACERVVLRLPLLRAVPRPLSCSVFPPDHNSIWV
jgi:hypothetical protein